MPRPQLPSPSLPRTPLPVSPAEPEARGPVEAPGRVLGWNELFPHRGALVRFAERRLRDPSQAEDLVHDVFEAAATGRARYGGRSAVRSWLVGILKHKIVDLIRDRSGHESLDALSEAGDGEVLDLACPAPGPEEQVAQRQRLRQTLVRLEALPDGLRRAVDLRLIQDLDTAETCRALSITEGSLFVRLHRARRHLAS